VAAQSNVPQFVTSNLWDREFILSGHPEKRSDEKSLFVLRQHKEVTAMPDSHSLLRVLSMFLAGWVLAAWNSRCAWNIRRSFLRFL
jgi:hypothetical protein